MLLDIVASVPLILIALSAARGVLLYFKDKVFKEVVLGVSSGFRWVCFGFYYFWAAIVVFICCGPADYVVNGLRRLHTLGGEEICGPFDDMVPAELIGLLAAIIVAAIWLVMGVCHLAGVK